MALPCRCASSVPQYNTVLSLVHASAQAAIAACALPLPQQARRPQLFLSGSALAGPSTLQAGIVVLATGYRSTARDLLPADLQAKAGYKGENQWLYRWGARHPTLIGLGGVACR